MIEQAEDTRSGRILNYDHASITRDAVREEIRDWRLATFSVALPIPDGWCQRDEEGGDLFVDLSYGDSGWISERYRGLGKVDLYDLEHEVSEAEATSMAPAGTKGALSAYMQAFPSSPENRFGALMGGAVHQPPTIPYETPAVEREAQSSCFTLYPDPAVSGYAFDLKDGGRIQLRAAELLQYREAEAIPDRRIVHRVLVLHVVVEHCSSASLQSISQGLRRPRAYVDVNRPDGMKPLTPSYPNSLHPLEHFFALVQNDLVDHAVNHQSLRTLKMSRGGYLELTRSESPGRVEGGTSAEAVPRRTKLATPERSCLAIPGSDVPPPPFDLHFDDERCEWSDAEKWGWVLAGGLDEFAEVLPAGADSTGEAGTIGDFHSWTVWVEEGGTAFVRHDTRGTVKKLHKGIDKAYRTVGETVFLVLAQTRMVDLLVLNMRAYSALQRFAEDLAEIDSTVSAEVDPGPSGAEHGKDDESRWERAQADRLQKQMDRLERIEADFVLFRDRLWFNSIPRRRVDTQIFLKLRDLMGVDRAYDDFTDELELRHQVYSTQHASQQMKDARRREEARRRSEENRQAEAEIRAGRSELLNIIIGVVGTALAAPAFVEAFAGERWGEDETMGWWAVGVTIGLAAIVGLAVFCLARWRRRRREEKGRQQLCGDASVSSATRRSDPLP